MLFVLAQALGFSKDAVHKVSEAVFAPLRIQKKLNFLSCLRRVMAKTFSPPQLCHFFPSRPWEARVLLTLCTTFSFLFILCCWKAAQIRGRGTVFSSVLTAAILQIQSAWLYSVTLEGELHHTSNSMYFNAGIFYQQRNRGECTADRLFLSFPCGMKGDSSEEGTSANAVLGAEVEVSNLWLGLEA